MLANVTIIGNLGKDAEVRATGKGDPIARFSVATTHGYGERKRSTWWSVTVFGKSAEFAGQLRKGDRVCIVGDAFMDTWQGKDGERLTLSVDAREVKALSPKSDSQRPGSPVRDEPNHGDDDSGVPF
jgi:single-strand DNA-binding protein